MWEEPNILQIAIDEFLYQKKLLSSFDVCSYRSRIAATFANISKNSTRRTIMK